jgi:hypothetical protein
LLKKSKYFQFGQKSVFAPEPYFDVWTLLQGRQFNKEILSQALQATIERRGRKMPTEIPVGLKNEFAKDPQKILQWKAFLRRLGVAGDAYVLEQVVGAIREFLEPVILP